MAPAFVTGPSLLPTFPGCRVASASARTRGVRMSMTPITRRDALLAGAALLAGIPAAALAKSGDSPKISVFGVGGASSPFTAGVQSGGKLQYKSFNEDEITLYKRIVDDSKARLEGAIDSIKSKSWEDVRSSIRLEASDLRKTQLTVNANIEDDKESKKATKAYLVFKNDLENLDQAAVQKNQDRAYKAYNAALKSLGAWQEVAGF